MAKQWVVRCKDCGEEFGYSDWSNQIGNERGQSRPERCPECRKKHNRQTGLMGVSYFIIKPKANSDTTQIHPGKLGALSHSKREHQALEIPSNFDPNKFGVTDDDIRAIFDWLSDPKHQVAVVVGPTGSGKSTALPYRLIHPPEGIPEDKFTRFGQVLITQPRIQATRNIPAYVAEDLYGSEIGSGFDIGFRYKDHPYSDWRNRLVYATDGTLINWIVSGQIANLSVIMIDEAHERSLNIDLILGLLKKLLPRYPHLKLIVASATIDSGLFINYFGTETAKLIEFKGMRKYNVDEYYMDETEKLPYENIPKLLRAIPNEIAKKVVWLLKEIADDNKTAGDILAFLQGEKPIEQAVSLVKQAIKGNEKLNNVDVYPLYTTLPQGDQDKALKKKPDPTRHRVVITTNVAETSLTVEDIVYVVDSGLINEAQWNPDSQTKQIVTVCHSQAGCKQRWGRAGRVKDGEAYCLYTETQFNNIELFHKFTTPQIQRSDLEPVVLAAKAAGIDDLTNFDWIQKPPLEELERAPLALQQIGALDSEGFLTEHGLELQSFGEEPALAHLMAMADQFSCAIEIATFLPMMKLGGLRFLFKNDRNWDATTKRAVERIHQALKKGCRDDLEFCLKLYMAWAEGECEGHSLAPIWAIQQEWPRFIPKFTETMKASLGDKEKEFRQAIVNKTKGNEIRKTIEEFKVEPVPEEWVKSAEEAFLRAEREAWGKSFYINTSLIRDKVDPERNTLLDALSGHKKEDERRPIDYDLLNKVRILMAYCLTDRIFEQGPEIHGATNLGKSDEHDKSYINRMKSLVRTDTNVPIIQINNDSILFDRKPETFVCGKQQVIVHPIDPDPTPVPVMHVSYLAELNPSWLDLIEKSKYSIIALGKHISVKTAKGKISSGFTIKRLFLDQVFPVGSRYECELSRQSVDGSWELKLRKFIRYPLEITEGFRGDEPEVVVGLDTDETNENGELIDTVLTEEDILVMNPEEEIIPAWEDLANDSAEIEETDSEIHIDQEEDQEPQNRHEISYGLWPDGPRCILITDSIGNYKIGEAIITEIVDYTFSDEASTILLKQVPEHEPFDVFIENYKAGDEVDVEVIAHDERPGDFLVSLVVRESLSGLEILLEPERISFSTRGFFVKEIPIGTKLRVLIESINQASQRVYLTYLHQTEKHLEAIILNQRSTNGIYEVDSVVKEVAQGRVHFMLNWSDPGNGFIHVASVAGKGLHKGNAESYSIGEVCRLKLQFSQHDAHSNLDELPDDVADVIGKQKAFINLSYEDKTLSFHNRMSYNILRELLAASTDKKYQRALYDIYRFSNMFIGFTIDTDWGTKAPSIGNVISNGKVSEIVGSGALIELGEGIKGLLHNNDMTQEVNTGDQIIVTVRKIDIPNQRLSLYMGQKFLERILVPQNKMPLIIGRGGENIKGIRERNHVNIDDTETENNQNEFYIWGNTLGDVQNAKNEIKNLAFPFEARIEFPLSKAGILIGRGGEAINRLKHETGTNIQITNGTINSLVVVQGPEENVKRAIEKISSIASPYPIRIL